MRFRLESLKWSFFSVVLLVGASLLSGCQTVKKTTTLTSLGLTPDAAPNGVIVRVINRFFNPKVIPYEFPYTIALDPSHPFVVHCEHNRVVRVPDQYKSVVIRFIGRSNGYIQAVEFKWVDWEGHITRRYFFHQDIDKFLHVLSPVPVNSAKGFGMGNYLNGCTDPLLIVTVDAYPGVVNEFNFLGDFIEKVLYPQNPLKAFSFVRLSK